MSSGAVDSSEVVNDYGETAFRSDAIPTQKPLDDPGGFARALEGGDLIERLPWGHYGDLNISLSPNSARIYQRRAQGNGPKKLAGPKWTHKAMPSDFIKTRWQLVLMLAGSFADKGMIKFFLGAVVLAALLSFFAHGSQVIPTFSVALLVTALLHLFFRYPFTWFLESHPDFIVKDLGCGFFRPTGMVKFRTWREETFEAPFIEFDPYISFHVQPKGPTSCKLQLRHRYTGWQTVVASVHSTLKHELYAHWDELQRYMDVSQPLPDIPALEPYRHLDPTTAEYDAAGKRGRPADYWATLDLDWWEKEGYPKHQQAIRDFPWDTLEDRMQYSVANLNEAAMV
ncbi:hypothetical protein CF392_08135 [Tamilnaduibacter salinus]|uniref:Uncharacterized protein n=1 Tax=Tamilnaduibacter salinus TaxID=1484056 RepID=A0A2A2I3S0_9GAMM|nr:hypothetical protein [Tamilnaduibacter salinus]PAV25934.1 hypothetical protein CF392_08135 [Tamilnaduibacter salinus]